MNVSSIHPDSKTPVLETPRTLLRKFTLDDVSDLMKLHGDPDVMRYLVGETTDSPITAKASILKYIAHYDRHQIGKWAVVEKNSGTFIGRAGLVVLPVTGEIDLGYALVKNFWGKGYATEIADALASYALTRWPKEKIVGLIRPGNLASANVLQKIGFKLRGHATHFEIDFDVYTPA
jgi:ribosomal-protein-alanine N-acetyltransferase